MEGKSVEQCYVASTSYRSLSRPQWNKKRNSSQGSGELGLSVLGLRNCVYFWSDGGMIEESSGTGASRGGGAGSICSRGRKVGLCLARLCLHLSQGP